MECVPCDRCFLKKSEQELFLVDYNRYELVCNQCLKQNNYSNSYDRSIVFEGKIIRKKIEKLQDECNRLKRDAKNIDNQIKQLINQKDQLNEQKDQLNEQIIKINDNIDEENKKFNQCGCRKEISCFCVECSVCRLWGNYKNNDCNRCGEKFER